MGDVSFEVQRGEGSEAPHPLSFKALINRVAESVYPCQNPSRAYASNTIFFVQ